MNEETVAALNTRLHRRLKTVRGRYRRTAAGSTPAALRFDN